MKGKRNFILFLILIVAFFLRFYKLDLLPLYGDELTMVYDSYSILKTGKDQWGNFMPLTFRMGAGRPAGYVYFSAPFVALFGPSAFGVRLLSVFSGVGIVFLMYLLGRKLFNYKVGLISSFLMAFSLWDISLSRVGFEAHFALFLSLLGITFFIYADKRFWFYPLFALSWGLAIHTYPIYKLVLFLFFPFLIWYKKEILIKNFKIRASFLPIFISFLIGFIAISFSLRETFVGISEERFLSINVFSRSDLKERVVSEVIINRSLPGIHHFWGKILFNKPVYYFLALFNSYLRNFSMDFLFISGDANPVHNLFEFGQMYYVDLFLIFLGIIFLVRLDSVKSSSKLKILLISWLLISPLGSVLLLDQHALRSSFMLPVLIFLSALGLDLLWSRDKIFSYRFLLLLVSVLFSFQLILSFVRLFFVSPYKNSHFWSYQAKKAVILANEKSSDYDYVLLSNKIDNIEYAYQVYNRIDPNEVIKQNLDKSKRDYYLKSFSNVYIVDLPKDRIEDYLDKIDSSYIFIGDWVEEKDYLKDYLRVYDPNPYSRPILIKYKNK